MDRNVRYVVLIGAGGLGVYLAYKYASDSRTIEGKLYAHGYLEKWFPDLYKAKAVTGTSGGGPAGGGGAAGGSSGGSGAPGGDAKVDCKPDTQTCWDGSIVRRLPPNCAFATCPTKPGELPKPKTAAELAADVAAAARTQLGNQLLQAGVDPQVVADYIAHCGANGQCDADYREKMLEQAALGNPGYMRLTDVGGILYTADEWQFYRAAGGGAELDPGDIFTDRNVKIHASDFVRALNQFSSGGGMSGIPAHVAWCM